MTTQYTTEPATGTGGPPLEVTAELLSGWATNPAGPVALHLKQKLLPVEANEGEAGIIYPPTRREHRLQHRHAVRQHAGRADR
jgi:hypothetical protein